MPTHFMLNQTLSLQLVRDQKIVMPVRTVDIASIVQKMVEAVVYVGKCKEGSRQSLLPDPKPRLLTFQNPLKKSGLSPVSYRTQAALLKINTSKLLVARNVRDGILVIT